MNIQEIIYRAFFQPDLITFKRRSQPDVYSVGIYSQYPRTTGNGLDLLDSNRDLALLEIEDLLAEDWEEVKRG